MSGYIRLEDGRGMGGPSVVIDSMLTLVANHIGDGFEPLRVFLADKAKRPAPFLDFNLGGLTKPLREEIYAAAARALSATLSTTAQ